MKWLISMLGACNCYFNWHLELFNCILQCAGEYVFTLKKNALQWINVVSFIKQGRVVLNTNNNFITIYYHLPVNAKSHYILWMRQGEGFHYKSQSTAKRFFLPLLCWVAYIHLTFYRPLTLCLWISLQLGHLTISSLGISAFIVSLASGWSSILAHIRYPWWRCIT